MKVICSKGKGLKKCIQNATKCIHCQQKCIQHVYSPIYIYTIKWKASFFVSSFHKPHQWRSDVSSRKHREIGKSQSMVWLKYTFHMSTDFCTCNFSTLCMLLKLSAIFSTVDWHPHARNPAIIYSCIGTWSLIHEDNKLFITLMSDSEGFDTHESLINISLASRNLFHVCHTVLFPFLRNWDTVSQPVKAYQKSTALHISSPKALA